MRAVLASNASDLSMPCSKSQKTSRTIYQSSLYKAVSRNDLEATRKLLTRYQTQIDLDKLGNDGISALHKCCIEGYDQLVILLLDSGANIEVKDPEGWTPLHACAAAGEVDILNYLLKRGANVMTYNKHGQLPIDVTNDVEIFSLLSKSMAASGHHVLAKKYLRSYKSNTIMEMSVIKNTIEQCLGSETKFSSFRKEWKSDSKLQPRPILKRSQSLTVCKQSIEETPLKPRFFSTSSKDRLRKVSFPADVLCQACIADNDHEDLKRLVSSGRLDDINKLDENGISAIHLASLEGSIECLTVLIENGARIDNRDPIGWTALHAAVAMGNIACVKMLLDGGADLNSRTDEGESVFDLANDDLMLEFLRMTASGSNSRRIQRQRSRRFSNNKTFSICSTSSSGSSSGSE